MNQKSFEEAVSVFCDKYCRYPLECKSQDELDIHCDNCDFTRLISEMFPSCKEETEIFKSSPYWSFPYKHKIQIKKGTKKMETTIIRHSTEETSWLKIKEAVNCNGADSFRVRDKIITTLKDGQQVEFVVAGINLYSKNELVLVLGDDLLKDECVINRKCTNAGGWAESYLRKYCNNEVYELLPDELKAVIAPRQIVQVVNGVRYETEDKLWAPSEVELFGRANGIDVEDVHFPIFDSRKSRIKFRNGYQDWYSTRSPLASSSTTFCTVHHNGTAYSNNAHNSSGVAFGFLIKP